MDSTASRSTTTQDLRFEPVGIEAVSSKTFIEAGPPAQSQSTLRLAFLSTMPPARCGLATFGADLMGAIALAAPDARCLPVAMASEPATPMPGCLSIVPADPASYDAAADALNDTPIDLLCLQHEYGIYGGPDGELLLRLLDRVRAPVVATLHTVLDEPSANQRRVMDALVARASRLVVMTELSATLMTAVHGVPRSLLSVVPHGIPDTPPVRHEVGQQALGAEGRIVLLTFGLLSPGKGIEHVIRALPAIAAQHPNILYVVLGATHPNLVREAGESYRQSLVELARSLDMTDHVRFLDRFVDLPELTTALAGTDIYLTPYQNAAQSVSGTLAYSYGLGTAVISTPYRHAVELLADGRGMLVPFADPDAIAGSVLELLGDRHRLLAMRAGARAAGREMVWPRIGARYLDIFREVLTRHPEVAG